MEAARVVRPGQIISRELEARGWSQKDLAEIMGRPFQAINEIIGGSKQITTDTAVELAKVFETSPEFWMNLETNFRLHQARKDQGGDVIERRRQLFGLGPIKEIIRRGWIKATNSIDEMEEVVCAFFEIESPNEKPAFSVAVSRRHSEEREPVALAQVATLKRALHLAKRQKVPRFDLKRFRAGIGDILKHSQRPEAVAEVPKALKSLGVRFVVVPHLPQSFLDGATFNPDGTPIIMLTARYDRIDNFWFTLMHEVAHLERGHKGVFVDNDVQTDAKNREELLADKMARDWLIDPDAYQQFLKGQLSARRIISFAESINRHPGIVVGRLHHDGKLEFSQLRSTLEKVRPYITDWPSIGNA